MSRSLASLTAVILIAPALSIAPLASSAWSGEDGMGGPQLPAAARSCCERALPTRGCRPALLCPLPETRADLILEMPTA
jgi:hypothetical protein